MLMGFDICETPLVKFPLLLGLNSIELLTEDAPPLS